MVIIWCVTADGVSGQSNYVKHLCTVYVVKVYYMNIFSCVQTFGLKLLSSYMLQRFDLMWLLFSSCHLFKKEKKEESYKFLFLYFGNDGHLVDVGC